MFRDIITSTPFHADGAEDVFDRVSASAYNSDLSLSATIRALIFPRMGAEDTISLSYQVYRYNEANSAGCSDNRIARNACGVINVPPNSLVICSVQPYNRPQTGGRDFFDAVQSGIPSLEYGYTRVSGVRDLFRKAFPIECFVDTEGRRTLVFVENLNLRKFHALQHGIFAMFPWYCTKERGMTADERELLFSLKEPTPDKYQACLEKLASAYDFRSVAIRTRLEGFERRIYESEAERLRRDVVRFDSSVRELNERISAMLRDRQNCLVRALGLEAAANTQGGKNELMDYFLSNKALSVINTNGNAITFMVRRYLDFFDPEAVRQFLNNRRSIVYSQDGFYVDDREKRIKDLMTELFLADEPRMRVRFCAVYRIELANSVTGISNQVYYAGSDGYMPNPHIYYHSCLGDYTTHINECIAGGNYVGAVEQCAASCASLNWLDQVVLKDFIKDLWGGSRCIELPDGRVVNAVNASNWLEEQDKKEESV